MHISIIIPVFNEHPQIADTLAGLGKLFQDISHEIIVVDAAPEAATRAFLESMVLPADSVRLLTAPKGRGPQMNAGATAASGDLLFFVHADSRPDTACVRQIIDTWNHSDTALLCGAFDLAIDSPRPIFRLIETVSSARSRLTGIPYGDQGIFISRILFEAIGGFAGQPLMEDVALMSAVKKMGIRPCMLPGPMKTSARRWESRGIIRTTLSNWTFLLLYLWGVSAEKLARWYYK